MLVYLNGQFMPAEQARISPFDRGFLYGDGIYEVTPSYGGKMVGFGLHLARMKSGLASIGIDPDFKSDQDWRDIAERLMAGNGNTNLGVYFQVSRGDTGKRFHGFPQNTPPTVFGMVIEIAPHPEIPDRNKVQGLRLVSQQDRRWRNCNIKSTSLLGNVLHFQHSYKEGLNETLLYNERNELTEASHSNVFIVKDGRVITPPLDHQILPGISRHIALACLRKDGKIHAEERVVTMAEVVDADEIWITNSSKHIAPVIELDGRAVGDGKPGPVWQAAMTLYEAGKFTDFN